MNAIERARMAYGTPNAPVRTPRGLEYDAFARITRRLADAISAEDFHALAGAVHENRRLWNHLALHLADAANRLPEDLRARLFYLAEFTETTSRKALMRQAGCEVLVEINKAVMGGLRSSEGAA